MKDRYGIKPFNGVFIGLFLANVILCVVLSFVLHNVSFDVGKKIVFIFGVVDIIYFIFYRIDYSRDLEYIEAQYGKNGEFNWYNELPLNPCNILLLVDPFAILIGNRYLLAFCFFFSIVSPSIAIINPIDSYSGYSIFKTRVFGYFETHYLTIVFAFLMLSAKIYYPSYADIVPSGLLFLAIAFVCFLVNEYLRKTGLNKEANYFFTSDPAGYGILEKVYKIIHVKYLFAATMIVPFMAVFVVITFLIQLIY